MRSMAHPVQHPVTQWLTNCLWKTYKQENKAYSSPTTSICATGIQKVHCHGTQRYLDSSVCFWWSTIILSDCVRESLPSLEEISQQQLSQTHASQCLLGLIIFCLFLCSHENTLETQVYYPLCNSSKLLWELHCKRSFYLWQKRKKMHILTDSNTPDRQITRKWDVKRRKKSGNIVTTTWFMAQS